MLVSPRQWPSLFLVPGGRGQSRPGEGVSLLGPPLPAPCCSSETPQAWAVGVGGKGPTSPELLMWDSGWKGKKTLPVGFQSLGLSTEAVTEPITFRLGPF